jgi:diguanylate cyclase (GGDEF)-like protein/PAS domain S-box-containing protein
LPAPGDAARPVPYQKLLHSLPDPTVLIDSSGSVRWANHSAERQLGMAARDWIGRSGLELVHPADLEQAILAVNSVQTKEVGSPIEVRIRTRTGWRLAEVVGAPVPDGEGDIVLTLRDLTDRRRWEIAGDETGKLRALLHHAATLFILLDGKGCVQASSGAITRSLGHDQATIEGSPMDQLVHPAERSRLRSAIERARLDGWRQIVPERVEVQLRDELHQRYVPHELCIVDLTDDPTVGGLVVTGHDVSERTATEEDLRDMLSLLNATLDATADGILVVDRNGHITSYNSRFVDMWRLPLDLISTGADQSLLRHVSDQLRDPVEFLATVEARYADPEAESFDVLTFKDGRVYERYSKPQRVGGAVVGRVWGFHDITRQKQLEWELEHQAFHDPLTGLANQALFRDRVHHAVARASRDGNALAVLYLDIDDFKRVNDSLGHTAGDELIVAVAERLRQCIRESDTAARLGGDEFAVLVEGLGSSAEAAEQVAGRIIEEFGRRVPLGSRELITSVSVGVAFGQKGLDVDQLMRNADLAMYAAKRKGKARFEFYAPGMHSEAVARLELEADLHAAVARNEFWVAYQPIVDLPTGAVAGMEALVRWQHPEWGIVGPDVFVGAAEDVGIIGEIGRFVLGEACAQARRWGRVRSGVDPSELTVAVNVSSRQLANGTVVHQVEEALARTGLEPSRLVLELTETAMLEDNWAVKRSLDELKRIGARIALDDFGTGYSSLTHLQQFPIDILKIDRSFMTTSGNDAALVKAVIRMSQELGMVAVAEGVETEAQAEFLRDAGCRYGQGHLFARPQPASAVDAMLESRGSEGFGLARPADVASV